MILTLMEESTITVLWACLGLRAIDHNRGWKNISARVYSGGEFPGLKTTVFGHFWPVLGAYNRHTPPTYWSTFSPDLYLSQGVKNPWKIGGNPPIGGKEYTLSAHYRYTWPIHTLHVNPGVGKLGCPNNVGPTLIECRFPLFKGNQSSVRHWGQPLRAKLLLLNIVACQQGGVSEEPPWLWAVTRPVLLRQGEPGTPQYNGRNKLRAHREGGGSVRLLREILFIYPLGKTWKEPTQGPEGTKPYYSITQVPLHLTWHSG